ncbi:MAG: cell division protein PerM [Actinomycetota bacterium]
MRCPSCAATIVDDEASFCPRCATPLGAAEGHVTVEISDSDDSGATERIEQASGPPDTQSDETGEPSRAGLGDVMASVARGARSAGWTGATTVAFFGFLSAVALGAGLVLGAKLQYPGLGEEASYLARLDVIVIAGLGVLGAPIHIGDLSISALPIGALVVVGWALVWATRRQSRDAGAGDVRSAVVAGAKVAIPLGVMCLIAAIFFRINEDPSPIRVDPFPALLVGGVWGALFGSIGGLLVAADLGDRVRGLADLVARRSRLVYEGAGAAALMLTSTVIVGAAGTLLWLIVVFARGPADFGWGEAAAAFVYMVAFLPNIVVSVVAIALGAPVDVGAQVTVAGRVVGPLREVSLLSGDLPYVAFALLTVPLAACFVGGYSARRTTSDPERVAAILGAAALIYAFLFADLAILADARVGAGLVRSRGFALIAPRPLMVFLLSLVWATALGYAGWWYAARGSPRTASPEIAIGR